MTHIPHGPLNSAAREAMSLGKDSGNKAFQHVALCMMGVSALAMTSKLFLDIWKELNRKHERRHEHERHESWRDREHSRHRHEERER